jgi:hypothetical protein
MNLKIGDLLIAKDVCQMGSGENTLTIGNFYEVIDVYDNGITIIDDFNDEHDFWGSRIDEFFNVW